MQIFSAVTPPLLLFGYGIFRFLDGLDGDRGGGLAWDVGHALFLLAMVGFGWLAISLRRRVAATHAVRRVVATTATGAVLVGAAAFVVVIAQDLVPALDARLDLPAAGELLGPLVFEAGMFTLLLVLATARPRQLPWWSPPAVVVGFVALGVNLDLLPLAALVILAGLSPLARRAGVTVPESPRPLSSAAR